MKIVQRKSPLWNLYFKLWPGLKPEHVLVAFGKRIYTPQGYFPREDLIFHETVHLEQQRHSYFLAALWTIRYLLSKEFRLKSEIEAYGQQMLYLLNQVNRKGRKSDNQNESLAKMVEEVSNLLSNGMYGDLGSKKEVTQKFVKYFKSLVI